jgi:chitosanase
MEKAKTPSDGGSEKEYLAAFLDVRRAEMLQKRPGTDTGRIDTEQRAFLNAGNLELRTPLEWQTYGETFRVP